MYLEVFSGEIRSRFILELVVGNSSIIGFGTEALTRLKSLEILKKSSISSIFPNEFFNK